MPEHERRHSAETEFEQRGPTVRDQRRIDPETYSTGAAGNCSSHHNQL